MPARRLLQLFGFERTQGTLSLATFGQGYAGLLGEINESWDEGFDLGTVSPCPGL